jgi:two-component system sensor kinase FixL
VQLRQVILNLIVNAFEAMDSSGQPRTLKIQTREARGEVVLDFVDSGPGIGADKLGSIFEPFVTTKKDGLGMGLALSRSIVTAHNGRLWAENNPGRGATFHLALPAARP